MLILALREKTKQNTDLSLIWVEPAQWQSGGASAEGCSQKPVSVLTAM